MDTLYRTSTIGLPDGGRLEVECEVYPTEEGVQITHVHSVVVVPPPYSLIGESLDRLVKQLEERFDDELPELLAEVERNAREDAAEARAEAMREERELA